MNVFRMDTNTDTNADIDTSSKEMQNIDEDVILIETENENIDLTVSDDEAPNLICYETLQEKPSVCFKSVNDIELERNISKKKSKIIKVTKSDIHKTDSNSSDLIMYREWKTIQRAQSFMEQIRDASCKCAQRKIRNFCISCISKKYGPFSRGLSNYTCYFCKKFYNSECIVVKRNGEIVEMCQKCKTIWLMTTSNPLVNQVITESEINDYKMKSQKLQNTRLRNQSLSELADVPPTVLGEENHIFGYAKSIGKVDPNYDRNNNDVAKNKNDILINATENNKSGARNEFNSFPSQTVSDVSPKSADLSFNNSNNKIIDPKKLFKNSSLKIIEKFFEKASHKLSIQTYETINSRESMSQHCTPVVRNIEKYSRDPRILKTMKANASNSFQSHTKPVTSNVLKSRSIEPHCVQSPVTDETVALKTYTTKLADDKAQIKNIHSSDGTVTGESNIRNNPVVRLHRKIITNNGNRIIITNKGDPCGDLPDARALVATTSNPLESYSIAPHFVRSPASHKITTITPEDITKLVNNAVNIKNDHFSSRKINAEFDKIIRHNPFVRLPKITVTNEINPSVDPPDMVLKTTASKPFKSLRFGTHCVQSPVRHKAVTTPDDTTKLDDTVSVKNVHSSDRKIIAEYEKIIRHNPFVRLPKITVPNRGNLSRDTQNTMDLKAATVDSLKSHNVETHSAQSPVNDTSDTLTSNAKDTVQIKNTQPVDRKVIDEFGATKRHNPSVRLHRITMTNSGNTSGDPFDTRALKAATIDSSKSHNVESHSDQSPVSDKMVTLTSNAKLIEDTVQIRTTQSIDRKVIGEFGDNPSVRLHKITVTNSGNTSGDPSDTRALTATTIDSSKSYNVEPHSDQSPVSNKTGTSNVSKLDEDTVQVKNTQSINEKVIGEFGVTKQRNPSVRLHRIIVTNSGNTSGDPSERALKTAINDLSKSHSIKPHFVQSPVSDEAILTSDVTKLIKDTAQIKNVHSSNKSSVNSDAATVMNQEHSAIVTNDNSNSVPSDFSAQKANANYLSHFEQSPVSDEAILTPDITKHIKGTVQINNVHSSNKSSVNSDAATIMNQEHSAIVTNNNSNSVPLDFSAQKANVNYLEPGTVGDSLTQSSVGAEITISQDPRSEVWANNRAEEIYLSSHRFRMDRYNSNMQQFKVIVPNDENAIEIGVAKKNAKDSLNSVENDCAMFSASADTTSQGVSSNTKITNNLTKSEHTVQMESSYVCDGIYQQTTWEKLTNKLLDVQPVCTIADTNIGLKTKCSGITTSDKNSATSSAPFKIGYLNIHETFRKWSELINPAVRIPDQNAVFSNTDTRNNICFHGNDNTNCALCVCHLCRTSIANDRKMCKQCRRIFHQMCPSKFQSMLTTNIMEKFKISRGNKCCSFCLIPIANFIKVEARHKQSNSTSNNMTACRLRILDVNTINQRISSGINNLNQKTREDSESHGSCDEQKATRENNPNHNLNYVVADAVTKTDYTCAHPVENNDPNHLTGKLKHDEVCTGNKLVADLTNNREVTTNVNNEDDTNRTTFIDVGRITDSDSELRFKQITDEIHKTSKLNEYNIQKSKIQNAFGIRYTKETNISQEQRIQPFRSFPRVRVSTGWKSRAQKSKRAIAIRSMILSQHSDVHDMGNVFIYSGIGRRSPSQHVIGSNQIGDQTLSYFNKTLAMSCNCPFNKEGGEASLNEEGGAATNWRGGKPIRVIRNHKLARISPYAPTKGFRYDGIYKVVKYYPHRNDAGLLVWKFIMRRDDPVPAPWTEEGKEYIRLHGKKLMVPSKTIRNMENTEQIKGPRDKINLLDGYVDSSIDEADPEPPPKRIKMMSSFVKIDLKQREACPKIKETRQSTEVGGYHSMDMDALINRVAIRMMNGGFCKVSTRRDH